MVAKSKKKSRRRKRVPVSKLVQPAGLRFDQTPGFAQWVPYVQRLTYEPQPNPVLQQKAMERQLEPRLHSGVRVMNPSLISTQTQTDPADTQVQTEVQTDYTGDLPETQARSDDSQQQPPPISRLVSRKSRSFGSVSVEPLVEPKSSYEAYEPIVAEVKPEGSTAMVPAVQQGPPKRDDIIRMWYQVNPSESQNWFLYPDNRPGHKKDTLENALLEFWSSSQTGDPPQTKAQKYLIEKLTKSKGLQIESSSRQSSSESPEMGKLELPPPAAGGLSSRQSSSDGVSFM